MARAGFSRVRVWRSHGLLSLSLFLPFYIHLAMVPLSLPFSPLLLLRLPLPPSPSFSLVLCASASAPLKHGFQKHQTICGVQTSLVNHNLIIIVFVFLVIGAGLGEGRVWRSRVPSPSLCLSSFLSSSAFLFFFSLIFSAAVYS